MWSFNRHQVLIERNFEIIHWYEIIIKAACDCLGGVFKLSLSFTLSQFECRSEDIPAIEGECHDFTNFKGRVNMSSDKASIVPGFLNCSYLWEINWF